MTDRKKKGEEKEEGRGMQTGSKKKKKPKRQSKKGKNSHHSVRKQKQKQMTINFIMLNFRDACLALMANFVTLCLRNRAFKTSYFEFLKVDKWVDFPFLWNINENTTTTSREFLKIEGSIPL